MKHVSKIMPFTVVFFLSIASCNENSNNGNLALTPSVEVEDGRLSFKSISNFDEEIKSLAKKGNAENNLTHIKSRIVGESAFLSLRSSSSELATYKSSGVKVDTLIQDDLFASFLNESREIMIDNLIYKITEEGTYVCKPKQYNRLIEIIRTSPKHGDSNVKDDEAGDSKIIEDGIFFFDSFSSQEASQKVHFEVAETSEETSISSKNTRVSYDYLPASVYNSFESHAFGKKTIVGKWIEKVLGKKETVYISFPNSDNERLKLSFYDTNYLVFKSIGIKAETQHKTWIGWGGNLPVQELRLGWDAINFTTSIPNAPSTGLPSVSFSKLNLGSLGIDVASFSILDGQVSDPLSSAITSAVKGTIDEALSTTVSKLYSLIKQNLGNQNAWERGYTAAFRIIYPNKVTTLLGRYEEIENNADKISRTFDWSTPILGFSTKGGSFQPIYKTGTTYDITKGSVYACAIRYGKTIGIRIVKD